MSLPRGSSPGPMHNVIVTGGSRGLGLAMVRRLSAEGYAVIVIARQSNDQLEATRTEAQSRGGAIEFVPFDLENIAGIPNLVKQLRKERGPIYGLVNNAGIGSDGALANMQNSQIERLIR